MKDITADELYNELPNIFFPAFLGEIVSMYGEEFYGDMGSFTWCAALKLACKKINAKWIYKKYMKMPWDEADEFNWIVSHKLSAITPVEFQEYQNYIDK